MSELLEDQPTRTRSGTRFLPLQEALPNSRFAMESTTTTAPDVTKSFGMKHAAMGGLGFLA